MEEEKDKRNAVHCSTTLRSQQNQNKKQKIYTPRDMGGVDVANEDQAEASPDGPACGSSKSSSGVIIPLRMATDCVGLEVRER